MSAFTNEVLGPLTDTELRATPVPISGTVTATPTGTQDVNVTNGSIPVTGPLTDTQLRATPVPISGSVTTTPSVSSSANTTQVTSTGANQTLLSSNASRKRLILFVNSGIWDVKLGATASATSRLMRVSSSSYYLEISSYTGQVDAVCTTAGKLVDVTELV